MIEEYQYYQVLTENSELKATITELKRIITETQSERDVATRQNAEATDMYIAKQATITEREDWYSPAHMDAVQERTIDPLRATITELREELKEWRAATSVPDWRELKKKIAALKEKPDD